MSTINKTTLQSYYQNIGEIYLDTKTEACLELIADAQNDTFRDLQTYQAGTRYNADGGAFTDGTATTVIDGGTFL